VNKSEEESGLKISAGKVGGTNHGKLGDQFIRVIVLRRRGGKGLIFGNAERSLSKLAY